jgi:hypothetical protein
MDYKIKKNKKKVETAFDSLPVEPFAYRSLSSECPRKYPLYRLIGIDSFGHVKSHKRKSASARVYGASPTRTSKGIAVRVVETSIKRP